MNITYSECLKYRVSVFFRIWILSFVCVVYYFDNWSSKHTIDLCRHHQNVLKYSQGENRFGTKNPNLRRHDDSEITLLYKVNSFLCKYFMHWQCLVHFERLRILSWAFKTINLVTSLTNILNVRLIIGRWNMHAKRKTYFVDSIVGNT